MYNPSIYYKLLIQTFNSEKKTQNCKNIKNNVKDYAIHIQRCVQKPEIKDIYKLEVPTVPEVPSMSMEHDEDMEHYESSLYEGKS